TLAAAWREMVKISVVAASSKIFNPAPSSVRSDSQCADFLSRDGAFLGLGGPLRMRAMVCWNGEFAFVDGAGQALDSPPQVPTDVKQFALTQLMTCGIDPDQQDIVRIADNT